MSVDLQTDYMGLKLRNPLVVSACPLTGELDNLRRLEDVGAAAAVLPSLFAEQFSGSASAAQPQYSFAMIPRSELVSLPRVKTLQSGPGWLFETSGSCQKSGGDADHW